MGLAISPDYTFALSVSADHLIGKYDLVSEVRVLCDSLLGKSPYMSKQDGKADTVRTKHPGYGSIAIKHDRRVCAAGGWDGK